MCIRDRLVAWFWFFGISVFSQEDPVLMRVNGKDILRSEFEYSYRHRTGNADEKLSPKEYAELFAQSKLKVEAAKVAEMCIRDREYPIHSSFEGHWERYAVVATLR